MSDMPERLSPLSPPAMVGPGDQLARMVSVAVRPLPYPFLYPPQIRLALPTMTERFTLQHP